MQSGVYCILYALLLRCWAYITIVKLLCLSVPADRNREASLTATTVGMSVICPE